MLFTTLSRGKVGACMATVKSVVDELRAKGKEKTRAIYLRHGMPADERTLGVSTADMKLVSEAQLILLSAKHMEGYVGKLKEATGTGGTLVEVGDRAKLAVPFSFETEDILSRIERTKPFGRTALKIGTLRPTSSHSA